MGFMDFFAPKPAASDILRHAIDSKDYRTASLFVVAGALEVLDELDGETENVPARQISAEVKTRELVRAFSEARVG